MTPARYLDAHALIIGISSYRHAGRLPEAVLRDAGDVAELLGDPQRCGYRPDRVKLLLDDAATRVAILDSLEALAEASDADDTVFIYFSGHGWRAGGDNTSFLLPVEASRPTLTSTAIAATELSDRLERISARRLTVVLDACHAGGAGEMKDAFGSGAGPGSMSPDALETLASGAGRAIIASSRLDETSLVMPGARNSAFTTAMLEGLSGAADVADTGAVKLFSLFDYVSQRVPDLTGDRQHPILRTKVETNFALAFAAPQQRGGTTEQFNDRLNTALTKLYPGGASDRDLWARAGGDLSELNLGKSGRSQWYEAVRLISNGGGGTDIDARRLVAEARRDFPRNTALLALT